MEDVRSVTAGLWWTEFRTRKTNYTNMNMWLTYGIIAVILLVAELAYFRIADKCNIIDKPNERSFHSTIVLRGGGIIFSLSMIAWAVLMVIQGNDIVPYLPFLCGLIMICTVSFWDDVHSLPDSVRMIVQIVSILLMFWSINLGSGFTIHGSWLLQVVITAIALFFCVGATNIINFMDGINGITAAYAFAMLLPLALINEIPAQGRNEGLGSLSRRIWWWPSLVCWCSASSTSGLRVRRSALPGMCHQSHLSFLDMKVGFEYRILYDKDVYDEYKKCSQQKLIGSR